MSLENVDVVRSIYGAWRSEGSPVASGLVDPAIEWVSSPEAVDPRARIDEILDAGERVVVLATPDAGGQADTDEEVEPRQGYSWTIRGGRATSFERFDAPDDALRAAGLHC